MDRPNGVSLAAMYGPRVHGVALAIAMSVSACNAITNERVADPAAALSEPVFRCNVEPILVRQCSYTACHGIAGAALRVYSPGKLRAASPLDARSIDRDAQRRRASRELRVARPAFSYRHRRARQRCSCASRCRRRTAATRTQGGAIYTGTGDPQLIAIRRLADRQGGVSMRRARDSRDLVPRARHHAGRVGVSDGRAVRPRSADQRRGGRDRVHGAPRWAGHACDVCHTGAARTISLRLESDHPELFTDGWKPEPAVSPARRAENEHAGSALKALGDDCGFS